MSNTSTASIMITGAAGALGKQTVERLLDRVPAHTIAALARKPAAIADPAAQGVDVRQGDYDDLGYLEWAFTGIEKLLSVSTSVNPDGVRQHQNVLDTAAKVGVEHTHFTGCNGELIPDSILAVSGAPR